jgi:hypothetical protein
MRRFVAWVGGAVGGLAAYRFLRRQVETAPETADEPDTRAEELRARLAETREADTVEEERPAGTAAEAAADDPTSLEERRRRVHEEGRATLDEMQSE